MSALTGFGQVSLANMMEQVGEEKLKEILSNFSCPLNEDVENFLTQKAILFEKNGYSATHLVFASYKDAVVLVGYYALANKTVIIKGKDLKGNWRSRLNRFATFDEETKQYYIALPLIGQLGKNFTNGYNKLITGDDLLDMACEKIRGVQSLVGGRIAYLECEDIPQLTQFYEANGFKAFAKRNLDRDELRSGEKGYLLQMLRYFPSKKQSNS